MEIISSLPNEIIVFLMAMLPLTELRASIPYGIAILEMSPWAAMAFSLMGNILISIIIIYTLPQQQSSYAKIQKQWIGSSPGCLKKQEQNTPKE